MNIEQSRFEKVLLPELVEINIGKTPSRNKKEYFGVGETWLSIKDLNGEKYIDSSKEELTVEGIQSSNIKKIKKGTLLFSFKLSIGKVAIANKDLYTNEAIASFPIKNTDKLDLNYFYHVMKSFDFAGTGVRAVMGKTLNKAKLKQIKIPLPSLATQQKIAQRLDRADKLVQLDQQLLKKYEQLAESLFLEMFGDPVSNLKGWEKEALKSFTNISSGSTPSRKNKEYYKGEIPWVKTGEVRNNEIFETAEKITEEAIKNSRCKIYPKGSIIIAMYGQGKTRGKCAKLGIEATTNQACAVLPPSAKINFDFLFRQLLFAYEDLRNLGRGGNQPNLNSGLIKNYKVIIPPISLQTEFAEKIQNIERQKTLARQGLAKSEELFQGLLQEAFRGV